MILEPTYQIGIEVAADGWEKIPPIDVKPGDTVRFAAAESTVWILIPEGLLEHAGGTGAWSQTDAFVAFAADKEGTTVRVPESFPNEDRKIHYSVLARRGDHWDYVHGSNPPPGMIIRGSRN